MSKWIKTACGSKVLRSAIVSVGPPKSHRGEKPILETLQQMLREWEVAKPEDLPKIYNSNYKLKLRYESKMCNWLAKPDVTEYEALLVTGNRFQILEDPTIEEEI